MKKRNGYLKEMATFDIHMKDGREKYLNEIAKWFEVLYPERSAYYKWALKNLRSVQKNADASWTDEKGRTAYVKMRVPQELFLFIKQRIPDFGDDSSDMDLLCRVWCDLVRTRKDNRRYTRLYVTKEFRRESEPETPPSEDEDEDQEGDEQTQEAEGAACSKDTVPDGSGACSN